jgi:hypothetical protein
MQDQHEPFMLVDMTRWDRVTSELGNAIVLGRRPFTAMPSPTNPTVARRPNK